MNSNSTSDSYVAGLKGFYWTWYDELRLAGYLVATLVPSLFVADMLTRALAHTPLRVTVWRLLGPVGIKPVTVGAVLFGVYTGFLLLMYVDFKKRAQSILISIATLIGLVMLAINGFFVPHLRLNHLALIFVGALGGVLYGGGSTLSMLQVSDAQDLVRGRLIRGKGDEPIEFPRAERSLYVLLAGVAIVSLFEAHTQYPPLVGPDLLPNLAVFTDFTFTSQGHFPVDLAATGVFLITLQLFLGYDASHQYFVLGPAGSGKTHLTVGLFAKANEIDYNPRNSSQLLNKHHSDLIAAGEWLDRTRGMAPDLSFEFTSGRYFPKNIIVNSSDYPGEYLIHIPTAINHEKGTIGYETFQETIIDQAQRTTRDTAGDSQSHATTDGGITDEESSSERAEQDASGAGREDAPDRTDGQPTYDADETYEFEETPDGASGSQERGPAGEALDDLDVREEILLETIVPAIEKADSLLFVFDCRRFLEGEKTAEDTYRDIKREVSGKETIMVATKADLLVDEFEEETMRQGVWGPGSYEAFRDYINERLRENDAYDAALGTQKPYPVFFATVPSSTQDELDRLPDLGPNESSLTLYGYRQLLERIAR